MFRQHETIGTYQSTPKFQNRYIHNFPQQRPFNSMHQEYNFTRQMPQQNYEQHWCETCDRGFPSLDLLTKHKQEHKICNIDGCQFVAHPKVITKHIQMQHASGVYKKIAKLNNPEEIKKWIEERKKKYPTKVNMEKKAAEIKEKIERGERMGLKQIGYGKSHKTGAKRKPDFGCQNLQQKRHKKYGKNNAPALSVYKTTVLPKKVHSKVPNADESRKLKPFAGIQDIVMVDDNYDNNKLEETNCNFDIVDDDDEIPAQLGDKETNYSKPTICGALSSLIGNYGSSEDELEDNEIKSRCNIISPLEKVSKEPFVSKVFKEDITKNSNCNYDKSDDDSGPEEIQNIKKIETVESETKEVKLKMNKCTKTVGPNEKKYKHKINKPKPKVPSTLLQKLLHREIQQERNIVLQCIRHIVNNNFFDNNESTYT